MGIKKEEKAEELLTPRYRERLGRGRLSIRSTPDRASETRRQIRLAGVQGNTSSIRPPPAGRNLDSGTIGKGRRRGALVKKKPADRCFQPLAKATLRTHRD